MLKLEIDEFLFEVKDEIMSYEELGLEHASLFEKNFLKWLDNNNIKKKNIKNIKDKKYYTIDDESEIFDIADEYYTAYEQGKLAEFWSKFQ